jgi:hypothetical protein
VSPFSPYLRTLTIWRRYIYFEKRRIAEGKPKSEARLENEDDFPNGFPLRDGKKHIHEYICVAPGWDYICREPGDAPQYIW